MLPRGGSRAKVLIAYGFEPGAAQRLDPESRFYMESAPTLRSNPGDNRTAVVAIEINSER